MTAYVSGETAPKSTEEPWPERRYVFMDAYAVRLLAS